MSEGHYSRDSYLWQMKLCLSKNKCLATETSEVTEIFKEFSQRALCTLWLNEFLMLNKPASVDLYAKIDETELIPYGRHDRSRN